jgi:hypothetical protein
VFSILCPNGCKYVLIRGFKNIEDLNKLVDKITSKEVKK